MDIDSYLNGLKSEVNDLHPLLNYILPKLPNIQRVEYTHGTHEFGADFVIQKEDITLESISYIGVVVKNSKITKSSTDVFDQIDECHMRRKFDAGKRKIALNEVWVITSGTISFHAKERIHEKYASTNVQFIDRLKLALWIEKYAPDVISTVTPALIHYFSNSISGAHDNAPSNSLLADLSNLPAIELEYDRLELDESGYINDRSRTTLRTELDRTKIVWLEAPMGYGKTRTLLELLTYYAAPDVFAELSVIPIHVTFREFYESYDASLDNLVESRTGSIRRDVCDDVKYLVLVDGVDEMLCEDESILSVIDDVLAELRITTHYKLVIASRPVRAGYIEALGAGDVTNVAIRPLSMKKLVEFIEAACSDLSLSQRIREDLKHSNLLRQLPHSPIAAILLSRVLRENPKDLPSNMTELYAQATELMLGRWDVSKELFRQIEWEVAETVSGIIARHIIDYGLPSITRDEFSQFFEEYLGKRNLDIDADELVGKLLQRCDIYVHDAENQRVWFSHRSFAEFLYAKSVYKSHDELLVGEKAFEHYWMTTYFFYVGLRKDCPDYLDKLMSLEFDDEYHSWMRITNMANYYLAAFATEYSTVEGDLHKIFIEAARLYLRAIKNPNETVFRKLTAIQVLFLVQFVIRNAYAFDYFSNALDATAGKLIDDGIDEEERKYACFFLSATCMELGREGALDIMVEHFDVSSLPLPMRLGISQEAKRYARKRQIPAALKKHNKKFRQMLRKNRGLRDKLDHYFNTPIQKLQ